MNKRARELAPKMDEFLALCSVDSSDTYDDNLQEQNSQGAGFHEYILPEVSGKGAGEDNMGVVAVAVRRTPPHPRRYLVTRKRPSHGASVSFGSSPRSTRSLPACGQGRIAGDLADPARWRIRRSGHRC